MIYTYTCKLTYLGTRSCRISYKFVFFLLFFARMSKVITTVFSHILYYSYLHRIHQIKSCVEGAASEEWLYQMLTLIMSTFVRFNSVLIKMDMMSSSLMGPTKTQKKPRKGSSSVQANQSLDKSTQPNLKPNKMCVYLCRRDRV